MDPSTLVLECYIQVVVKVIGESQSLLLTLAQLCSLYNFSTALDMSHMILHA